MLIVAIICGLQLSEQSAYISNIGNVRVPASTLMNTRDVTKDYYPKAALPEFKDILNHEAISGKRHIKVTPLGNGKYRLKTNYNLKDVQMPFVMYNGVKYRYKVNDKEIKYYSNKNQMLTMNKIRKGKHIINVSIFN